jgi:protease-4
LSTDKVRQLADGRAYTGRQALSLGLIDLIGGEPEARRWLEEQRHVSAGLPVEDVGTGGFVERTFGATLGGFLGTIEKTLLLQGVRVDGAWALWQPGEH